MSTNKTKWDLLLEIYAGVPDGRLDLSHDINEKWRISIIQFWPRGYERILAFGAGGTAEDAAAAATEDYYDRIDRETL